MTQRNPKTTLAYSSISQMGVIAAALGMGLASGDKAALADAAFYAANHALVKAALFLTVGVVATLSGRGRSLALIVAAFLGLSLAGLPLTGGALAKLALKGPFGDGAAGMAAQFSAAASTALMLCFVMRLARFPRDERRTASPERLWSWLALAARVVAGPVAHVPARRQSRRGVRAREALGRGLADADRRRAGLGPYGPQAIGCRAFPLATSSSPRRPRSAPHSDSPTRSSGPTGACASGRRRAPRCSWSRSPSPPRATRAGRGRVFVMAGAERPTAATAIAGKMLR